MTKIRIKNFGPIKEGYPETGGWMNIRKVTVFIGDQASGKSTVAKVISSFSWLEKAINRGDLNNVTFSIHSFKEYFRYQGIFDYFQKETEIEFVGDKYSIGLKGNKLYRNLTESTYQSYVVPKIMYIPAERNILSTISKVYNVSGMPEQLLTFAEELKRAQRELNGRKLKLPINKFEYEYEEDTDSSFIIGEDHRINLLYASSGLQSFVPLYLVSRNLAELIAQRDEVLRKNMNADSSIRMNEEINLLMLNDEISESERNLKVKEIRSKYLSKCLINIIEEPEQNLYPTSQRLILNSLLELNNEHAGNKLIMTTHSPYLINYLTLCIEAGNIKEKGITTEQKNKLKEIIPIDSAIKVGDLVIYQLDKDGSINSMGNYKGLPSDENKLNDELGEGNELFARLLEIEQRL
jgi:predicted ATPase